MAEQKKSIFHGGKKPKTSLIDAVYLKYTKSVIRALASTEFYNFFMHEIAIAQNEFQFSNRRLDKIIDIKWVEAVEEALESLQFIISNPRNIIREEEIIVNVAHAKKGEPAVVRHLAQHGALVDDFDEGRGEVRPNHLMQKLRDDSVLIYENRLVITVLEDAYHFVKIRYDALANAMTDEFGAKLKLTSNMESATENVHLDMFLHIKEKDDILSTDEKHGDVLSRVARLNRVLGAFMNSPFAKEMAKAQRVRGALVKTNVIKKNPNYKAVAKLYEFFHHYQEIGYAIKVEEQSPEINDTFQRDIFHGVMFNYIILKSYLEDEKSREVPTEAPAKRRVLKPKFIKEIIEELTEDYDLPDIEIRKVLIEELTKEQLMLEEAEERRRLVEEQERLKREEEERIRREQEEEEERRRLEEERQAEVLRKEQEAERARLEFERLERELEDNRRGKLFIAELEFVFRGIEDLLIARDELEEQRRAMEATQEFEDAARILEEQERLKQEEQERERIRKEEEKAQALWEKRQEELRQKQEERERRQAERIRLEEERKAAEQLQIEKDREQLALHITVLSGFFDNLDAAIASRRGQGKGGGA